RDERLEKVAQIGARRAQALERLGDGDERQEPAHRLLDATVRIVAKPVDRVEERVDVMREDRHLDEGGARDALGGKLEDVEHAIVEHSARAAPAWPPVGKDWHRLLERVRVTLGERFDRELSERRNARSSRRWNELPFGRADSASGEEAARARSAGHGDAVAFHAHADVRLVVA